VFKNQYIISTKNVFISVTTAKEEATNKINFKLKLKQYETNPSKKHCFSNFYIHHSFG